MKRMAKQNDGAPGVDGVTFEAIEAQGVEALLEQLRDELTGRTYKPLPARRQAIPKDGGKVRVLSIPATRDRRCKARSSSYSNLSSRRTSNRARLDTVPSGQHMTRSSGWPKPLSNGRHASSTLTCEPTLTMSGTTGCWEVAQQVKDADIMHLLKVMLKASGKKGRSPRRSNLALAQ